MTENELAVIEKLRRIGSHQITHERAIDALTTACAERDALRDALDTLAREEWRDDDDPILDAARVKARAALREGK